jgi:steroid 5-alpha reductase family enzyme
MSKTIRAVFSVFVVAMLAIFGWLLSDGAWGPVNWIILAVSAACCLLVFRLFLYLFSYSYGLCMLLNGGIILVVRPSAATVLISAGLMLYGIRMIGFCLLRDRSASYAGNLERVRREDAKFPRAVLASLWFMVTVLMTFLALPLWFVAESGALSSGLYTGAGLMLAGLALETLADVHKQRYKAAAPGRFVDRGLYARWRHPNFFGELVFHAGLAIAGLSAVGFTDPIVTLAAVIGPCYLVILMILEARRLDHEQHQRYAADPAYALYLARSGSLLPR